MKTALQELLKHIEIKGSESATPKSFAINNKWLVAKIQDLIKVEREQIIDAFIAGEDNVYGTQKLEYTLPETYFDVVFDNIPIKVTKTSAFTRYSDVIYQE